MTSLAPRTAQRAADLRATFDSSFVAPLRTNETPSADFIIVGAGHRRFAVRLNDVGGLFADKKITPLPHSRPPLAGITGIRGALVAVYSLRLLLRLGGETSPRWLIVTADARYALACERFDGHVRAPITAIVPRGGPDDAGSCSHHLLQPSGSDLPILDMSAVIADVRQPQQPQLS